MNAELPGTVVGLEVIRLIAHGGFASVYEVRDSQGGRLAVKQLHPELRSMPGVVEGFAREADFLISKKLPGVVRAVHFERAECALVMELLDGYTLEEIIRDGLPYLEMHTRLLIGIRLCEILQHIHDAGSLHLDLKPDNVILCADGRVVLTDFGVAATKAGLAHDRGPVMGAINYMAPESLLQSSPSNAGTDVYSLGVLLYELFSGRKPYNIEKGSLLREALHKVWPLDTIEDVNVPPGASLAVERCLAFEPQRRWQSAKQLGQMLQREVPGLLTEQVETDIAYAMGQMRSEVEKSRTKTASQSYSPHIATGPAQVEELLPPSRGAGGGSKVALWVGLVVMLGVLIGAGLWFAGVIKTGHRAKPVVAGNNGQMPPVRRKVTTAAPRPATPTPAPVPTATPTIPVPTPRPTATPVQLVTGVGSLLVESKPPFGTIQELKRLDDGLSYLRLVSSPTTPVLVKGLPAGSYQLTVFHQKTGEERTLNVRIVPNRKAAPGKIDLGKSGGGE